MLANTFELLVEQLKRHEWLRLKPYKCPRGKLTIGYGRNLDDQGISKGDADYLLHSDILRVTLTCGKNFSWFAELSPERQAVVINMVFNLGFGGFLKFKNVIHCVEVGNYIGASVAMLDSRWAKQVGNRAIELSKQMETSKIIG